MNGARGEKRAATKDHVNPKVLGGGPVIMVCAECNNLKGSAPLEDWLDFLMAERPTRIPHVIRELRAIAYMLHIPKEGRLRITLRAAQEMAALDVKGAG